MKKIIITASVCILLVLSIFLLTNKSYSRECPPTQQVVYTLSEEEMGEIFSLKDVENANVYMSIFQNSSEKIFIIEAKKGKIEEIRKDIQTYLSSLTYLGEEQEYVDNAITYEYENMYVVIVSKQAQSMLEEIKERWDV